MSYRTVDIPRMQRGDMPYIEWVRGILHTPDGPDRYAQRAREQLYARSRRRRADKVARASRRANLRRGK